MMRAMGEKRRQLVRGAPGQLVACYSGALLLPVLLMLTGCAGGPDREEGQAVADTHVLAGDVLYRERQALPAGAVVELALRDRETGQEVAGARLQPEQEVPVPFHVEVDLAGIDRERDHVLSARITDAHGRTRWHLDEPLAVDLAQPRTRAQLVLQRGEGDSGAGSPERRVDFLARGDNPGWQLEVVDREHIALVTDGGQTRIYTPAPEPEFDGGVMTYHSRADGHDLLVQVYRETCTDAQGESYPYMVDVELDGRLFSGCGRGGY